MENRCINTSWGGKRKALEICGGAVRRNLIPKSVTLFHTKKCDFPYSVLFQVKTGENSLHHFQTKRGIAIQLSGALAREAHQRSTMGKKIW